MRGDLLLDSGNSTKTDLLISWEAFRALGLSEQDMDRGEGMKLGTALSGTNLQVVGQVKPQRFFLVFGANTPPVSLTPHVAPGLTHPSTGGLNSYANLASVWISDKK